MKKIIIGTIATGKTTLIVRRFIPKIKKYIVFDFCNEYFRLIDNKENIKTFKEGLIGSELKIQVTSVIRSIDNDTVIIIDNTNLLYTPNEKEKDNGFLWLNDELKNKQFILVFQSIQSIIEGGLANDFDDVYYFETRDSYNIVENYLSNQEKLGKKVIFRAKN